MGLLDMFVSVKKDDEKPPAAPGQMPGKSIPQAQSQQPVEAAPVQTILLNGGVVDQKFVQHFDKVLDDANLPGPDYFEFRHAYADTEEFKTSMSEETRLKMVYKTMNSNGLTKEILLDSANQYKTILANDKTNFEGQVQAQRDKEIGGRNDKITALTEANQEKEKQIAQLQLEMQQNNETIVATKQEIANIGNKLDTSLTNFTVTYNAFVGQIDNDIAKITASL